MNRIRILRELRDWKQEELGQKLNVGKGAISRYETEKRQLDPATIGALCDLFGCTADYLLGRSASPLPVISPEDAAVLQAYHALPLEIRKAVDGLLEPYRTCVAKEKLGA